MKKTFVALVAAAVAVLSARAADWTTEVLEDGTLAITGAAAPASGAVEVPSEIGGKAVAEIGEYAFLDWTDATSFVLPDGLRSIGAVAFGGCTGLAELAIPASVTSIGDNAFAGCENLMDLFFDGDCPGEGSDNASLPEGAVVHVRSDAAGWGDTWSWCPVVRGTEPVDPLLTIENGVVTACKPTASGAISIPASSGGHRVTGIAAGAFAGCAGITSVSVPTGVRSVGEGAFADCAALEEIAFAGNAPSLAGDLGGDPARTRVIFNSSRSGWPESGTLFGGLPAYSRDYPSDGCWQVRDNGDGTVTLTGMAYGGETALAIPETIFGKPVTALAEGAFAGCTALETLAFPGDAPAVEGPLGLDGLRTVVCVPAGSVGWDDGSGFWEGCLVVWGDYPESFWIAEPVAGGVAITGTAKPATGRVGVPASLGGQPVVAIGPDVFAGCDGLLSADLPATVTDLADGAFEGCTALEGVVFQGDAPAGAGALGLPDGAAAWVREDKAGWGVVPGTWRDTPTEYWPVELLFDWEETDGGVAITGVLLDDMTAVTIPAGIDGFRIVAIGENAFASAPDLARVTFEGDCPAVAGDATGLDPETCVVFARLPASGWPGSELAPEPSVWQGCRLEFCTHPETVWATEERGDGTLAITGLAPGAAPLEGEAILPGEIAGRKVTALAPGALAGQEGLTAVWLHPDIESVGENAFSGTAIGSILLASNVTDVAAGALAGCTNLAAVYVATAAPPDWLGDMGADPDSCIVYAPDDADGWGELPAKVADYLVMPASHFETFWTVEENADGTVTITGTEAEAEGVVIVPATIGGKTVAAIGGGAFARQPGLTGIVLPDTIQSIGIDAFAQCPALADVTFAGQAPDAPDSVGLDPAACTVHAPVAASGWDHETGLWQGVPVVWYGEPVSAWEIRIAAIVPSESVGTCELTVEATCEGLPAVMPAGRFADAVFTAPTVAELPESTTRAVVVAAPARDASRLTFTVEKPGGTAPVFFCIKWEE